MASKKTSEILELRRQGLGYKTIAAITYINKGIQPINLPSPKKGHEGKEA